MEYLKLVALLMALLLLTSLLCLVTQRLLLWCNPLSSISLFLIGVLGVVVTIDRIEAKL